MKLKKLSGLLSAVLAGAMVLSMAPAAFAVATDELPAECDHIKQVAVDNHDGTCSYVCKVDGTVINTMEHIWDKDGTCVRCNAKKAATDTSDCEHKNNNWIYENLGDGTHNVVCKDCGETVSLAVPSPNAAQTFSATAACVMPPSMRNTSGSGANFSSPSA